MKVITLTHIKGGVTKTTTTVNIAYALALLGYKTLVIDADPQSNCTFTLTGRIDEEKQDTLYEALIPEHPKPITDLIKPTTQENLFVVESSMWLYTAEIDLAHKSARELLLRKAMRGVKGFDFVLIDTSPSLGLMTLNAWVASHGLIVPISLTTYGMLGIRILEYSLAKERRNLELDLPVLGVVGTLDDHTKNSTRMRQVISDHFGELVFTTVLPRNIKVEEANNKSISLFEFAPDSTGAKAYLSLVKELLIRCGLQEPE